MNRVCRGVILLISIATSYCSGFVYQIQVLRRWHDALQQYQYVIGLSDFHDKAHPINPKQRAYLERLVFRCPRKTTKIIVEDLSSASNDGRIACGNYIVNSRGGVLGGLADVLRRSYFDVENIEYRYCRVAALGPLINNLDQPFDTFSSANALSIKALYQEVMREMEHIRSYADGGILRNCYKKITNTVVHALKRLHLDRFRDCSVAQYCARFIKPHNRHEELQTLCTFDSDLLDLKLVHAVINAEDKQYILAVAGGTHIKHACNLLRHAGFKPVFTTQINAIQEHNLSKCLGSHIVDNRFCVKPEPVDITLLSRFLPGE